MNAETADFKIELYTDGASTGVFWVLLRKIAFEQDKVRWVFVEAGRSPDVETAARKFKSAIEYHRTRKDSTEGLRRVRQEE